MTDEPFVDTDAREPRRYQRREPLAILPTCPRCGEQREYFESPSGVCAECWFDDANHDERERDLRRGAEGHD